MSFRYQHTIYACFVGYIVQAIVNNFLPMLFITLQNEYAISLGQITSLITINFVVQLLVDFACAAFIDKIGYRAGILLAHGTAALGFAMLAVLPQLLPDAYSGILIAVIIYAVGGGLLEVLVSPIMESCPTDRKEQAMSLLHSFYCWGQAGVILLSTVFFFLFGLTNWRILALLWAIVPLCNGLFFAKVPIASLLPDNEDSLSIHALLKNRLFWILVLLMICAGACELAISQWASTFAERGLSVTKSIGDLAGPMCFALLMGTARLLYGKFGDRIEMTQFMTASGILCAAAYLLTALSPIPLLSLIGCGICGFSVGILWPGTFSIAAASLKRGGTAMFAFLALAGDIGCSAGPTVLGWVTACCGNSMNKGILAGTIFPLLLLVGIALYRKNRQSE